MKKSHAEKSRFTIKGEGFCEERRSYKVDRVADR